LNGHNLAPEALVPSGSDTKLEISLQARVREQDTGRLIRASRTLLQDRP
jgi:hypothetical protein